MTGCVDRSFYTDHSSLEVNRQGVDDCRMRIEVSDIEGSDFDQLNRAFDEGGLKEYECSQRRQTNYLC